MTVALAKQAQTEHQLRKEIDKLRLQLQQLADVRRDSDMAAQFSKVIKAKEEQLVMKDLEIKAIQVSVSQRREITLSL
jgi:multidrug efflux pump subunit AcrA (membrane-fusion protein)